jgi:hypothetical protein
MAAFTSDDCEEIAATAAVLKAIRDDGEEDYTLSGEDGRLGSDPEELALLALLASTFASKTSGIAEKIHDVMDRRGFDAHAISDILVAAEPEMGRLFDDIEKQARDLIDGAVGAGEERIARKALEAVQSRKSIVDGITKAAGYYTNGFFNKQIVPEIQAMIQEFLSNPTDPLASPDLAPLRALIDARFKSVPYWRVVANAAASRGYHWGYLKAAQQSSLTGYELVAVIDSRTSEICLELNGKKFWIADALAVMEPAVLSDDPEAVKQAMPWQKASDVKNLSVDELRALGCLVPPFHGNCRTTIRCF